MASINKVLLMGNLTAEPEIRYIQGSNTAVAEFNIATNRKTAGSNGEAKDEVCFVEIVVWGKQAESCQRYLQKGSSVLIEGRLVFEQWTERETQRKRSRLRVTAERVQFINNTRRVDGAAAEPTQQYQQIQRQTRNTANNSGHKYPREDVPQYRQPEMQDPPEMPEQTDPFADEDIPF